ncbi:MAG: hypothetical protein V3U75_06410 [Methylococcaceae bacterium]
MCHIPGNDYCAKYRVTVHADIGNECLDPEAFEEVEVKTEVIKELRLLIGDYLLAGALWLYPAGFEKNSLACYLSSHFKLMTGCKKKEGQDDEN